MRWSSFTEPCGRYRSLRNSGLAEAGEIGGFEQVFLTTPPAGFKIRHDRRMYGLAEPGGVVFNEFG